MRHEAFPSPARALAVTLLAESASYPAGSPDHEWRRRAAWKLDQMHRGIPVREWTDEPPCSTRRHEVVA